MPRTVWLQSLWSSPVTTRHTLGSTIFAGSVACLVKCFLRTSSHFFIFTVDGTTRLLIVCLCSQIAPSMLLGPSRDTMSSLLCTGSCILSVQQHATSDSHGSLTTVAKHSSNGAPTHMKYDACSTSILLNSCSQLNFAASNQSCPHTRPLCLYVLCFLRLIGFLWWDLFSAVTITSVAQLVLCSKNHQSLLARQNECHSRFNIRLSEMDWNKLEAHLSLWHHLKSFINHIPSWSLFFPQRRLSLSVQCPS